MSKAPDALSVQQIKNRPPDLTIDDIMRIQRRWAPIVKAANKPGSMTGQKYI